MTLNITHWNGGSGSWGKASNWSNGAPGSGSDAVIDASGAYGVTIAQSSTYSVGAVELNDTGATLALQGSLTVGQTIDLKAGTLALNVYGVLSGGTVMFDGGALVSQAGTFDHVAAVGPFAMIGDFQSLRLTHGFSATAAGGGAGQILLNGEDDTLTFEGSQTFDNATITMSGNGASIFGGIVDCTGTLTLGPHVTVTTVGTQTEELLGGSTIVSKGTIVSAAGSFFGIEISPGAFINEGLITANNLVQAKGKVFTNAAGGEIDIASGENFIVGGSFHNDGQITIGAGARLELQGSYAIGDLGSIQNGGEIDLQGTLSNAGQVLTLGQGALAGAVSITGTILGGVVRPGTDGAQALGATLNGVTWQGPLTLDTQYGAITIENGLTLMNGAGTGPGVAAIDGPAASLLFAGSQTFDRAMVELGAGQGGDSLTIIAGKKQPVTLTLGSGLVVDSRQAGSRASIDETTVGGAATLVNDGLILARAAGSTFEIFEGAIVNAGAIRASNGDQLSLFAASIANTGTLAVSGGASLAIEVGDSEELGSFANAGVIKVGAGGTFILDAASSLAALGSFTNKGTFALGTTLDLGGQSVTLGKGPVFGGALTLALGGFLENGVVALGRGAVTYSGGGFANTTVKGAVNLSTQGATAAFGGGVGVVRASGQGPGLITVTGAGATLNFYDPKGVDANAIDDVRIVLGNASTAANLNVFSYSSHAQTLTLGSGATLVSAAAGALASIGAQFDFPDTLVNEGTISAAAAGGTFTISDALVNNRALMVGNGDRLVMQGNLSGSGTTSIATGAVLDIVNAAAAGQTIAFADATGVLRLDRTPAFGATIAGFTAGDAIDLTGFAATGASVNPQDELVVTNNGVTVATLQLAGDYSHATFQLGSDGEGGVDITVSGAPARFSQAMAGRPPAAAAVVSSPASRSPLIPPVLTRPA